MSTRKAWSEVRANLRGSVSASAAAYGYTLTVFSSGSLGHHALGAPHVLQVLLFIFGAVLGFTGVEVLANGGLEGSDEEATPVKLSVWGNAHLPAAGLAVGASWLALQALDSDLAWLLIGLVATAVYLVVNAAQATFAARGSPSSR